MRKWLQSARFALKGIALALLEERNMKIHCCAAAIAFIASIILRLSHSEIAIVLIACSLVICVEFVNSAIERLLDMVKPRVALQLQSIKDMMAGTVLVASFTALLIGILLFVPKIVSLFNGLIAD